MIRSLGGGSDRVGERLEVRLRHFDIASIGITANHLIIYSLSPTSSHLQRGFRNIHEGERVSGVGD